MTQDEIIEMARQAGFDVKEWGDETLVRTVHSKGYFVVINQKIESFAELVAQKERDIQGAAFEKILEAVRRSERAEEREACAKVCDKLGSDWYEKHHPLECARQIRARGQA